MQAPCSRRSAISIIAARTLHLLIKARVASHAMRTENWLFSALAHDTLRIIPLAAGVVTTVCSSAKNAVRELTDYTTYSVNLSCTVVVGDADDIYSALKNASIELGNFSVYCKEEIPERWHFKNNRRAPPILVLADESYAFDDMYQNSDVSVRLKNGTSKFQLYIPIHLVRHLIVHIAVLTQPYITIPPHPVPSCILILSSLFMYPTDVQLDCSKRMSKFTLKCSYMFRFNNHHQGATICALLKL